MMKKIVFFIKKLNSYYNEAVKMSIVAKNGNENKECSIKGCRTSTPMYIEMFDFLYIKKRHLYTCPQHYYDVKERLLCRGFLGNECGELSGSINSKCSNCAKKYDQEMNKYWHNSI